MPVASVFQPEGIVRTPVRIVEMAALGVKPTLSLAVLPVVATSAAKLTAAINLEPTAETACDDCERATDAVCHASEGISC